MTIGAQLFINQSILTDFRIRLTIRLHHSVLNLEDCFMCCCQSLLNYELAVSADYYYGLILLVVYILISRFSNFLTQISATFFFFADP